MTTRHIAAVLTVVALCACNPDQGFVSDPVGQIAVAAGDFDDIADPLDRVPVDYAQYQGIISIPTWDPEWDFSSSQGTVEGLLGESKEVFGYKTVFIASGVRGLGEREYNGLDPDDHLVSDDVVIQNVRDYVQNGDRTLVLSDWSYDLLEAAFPDAVEFLNEDGTYDAAQKGEIGSIVADVPDEVLANELGSETMAIEYNYSNWAVMESVGPDTVVHITGDATYRTGAEVGDATADLTGVPMLISFQPRGALGRVVYSSFHIDAQNPGAIDTVLLVTVGDFKSAEPIFEQFEQ